MPKFFRHIAPFAAIVCIGTLFLARLPAADAPPAPTVRGSVVDDATNQPISVFKARTLIQHASATTSILRKGTNGKYEAQLPETGESYYIEIEADGYLQAASPSLAPVNGILEFNARLKKGNLYAGTVLQPDGKPAVGASVILKDPVYAMPIDNGRLRADGFTPATIAKTDATGYYNFSQQKDPMRALAIHDTGWAEIITDGKAPPPDITLHTWAKVDGRIMQGDKPVTNQIVLISPMISRPQGSTEIPLRAYFRYHANTDADGRFSFDHVIDGRSDFHVQFGGTQSASVTRGFQMTLELKPGEHRTLNLGGSGRTITGHTALADEFKGTQKLPTFGTMRLVGPKMEQPENWFSLSAEEKKTLADAFHQTEIWQKYANSPSSFPVVIDPDGSFRATDVPPGTYVLDITLLGQSPDGTIGLRAIGSGSAGVTNPEVPADKIAEPFDVGNIEIRNVSYPLVADPVPVFQAATYDGQHLNLSDYKGKFVLLDFWATWCGPCIAEMKHLEQLHATLANDPRFVIVSISVDDHIAEPAAFLKAHPFPWPQGFAGALDASPARLTFGIQGIPSLWLISPEGKILAKTADVNAQYQLQYLAPDGQSSAKLMSDELLDQTIKSALAR